MSNPTVACLVMVSNDEWFLPYTLESIAGVFERAVIYDIGSEDATPKIIDWFVDKEKHQCDFFVRKLPMCVPVIQGALRNAMIAEGRCDTYWLLDGDEININALRVPGLALKLRSRHLSHPRTRYGVVSRIEVAPDLRFRYDEERTHHRLYTSDAVWTGTHPGERPFYAQNWKSEMDFQDEVTVLHMHNALRSSKEDVALKRVQRKSQKSYHPGKLIHFNLLEEYQILAKPIEDWPVSPTLRELQNV